MNAQYVIRRKLLDDPYDYLQHYSICARVFEYGSFGWEKQDAQRFDDREHAEWVAGHILGAKVVAA